MNRPIPNLTWLRTFDAAARHLNFTAAGAELGLTQAAVSLHIKSLETRLGAVLFIREPRNLTLTEMGRAYLPAVSKAIEDLSITTTGLFGPALKKVVRLRAPVSTAILWLAPKLVHFHASHPEIEVRLISSIWADRLQDADVDIDLQLGLPDRFPGATEFLSSETITPICPSRDLSRYQKPADLLHAPLIHILGFEDHWTRYFTAHDLNPADAHYGFSVDTTAAALEMVSSGLGLAPVLTRFANQAIYAGRQIEKLPGSVPLEQAHFLADRSTASKEKTEVTQLKSWLRNQFTNDSPSVSPKNSMPPHAECP